MTKASLEEVARFLCDRGSQRQLTGLMFGSGYTSAEKSARLVRRARVRHADGCFFHHGACHKRRDMRRCRRNVARQSCAPAGSAPSFTWSGTRSHKQWRESQLDRLDWCWYIGLPFLSYLSIVANAIVVGVNATVGLAMFGGTVILLLVIGIQNTWDLGVWMAQQTNLTPL